MAPFQATVVPTKSDGDIIVCLLLLSQILLFVKIDPRHMNIQ